MTEADHDKSKRVILIDGKCGKTSLFKADKKQTKFSKRSVTWKKNETVARELIDIRSRKYSRSHNRELLVSSVCKENEGKSETESEGKIGKTLSNWSYQLPQKDRPCFHVWKVKTERKGITIYYRTLECSPKLNKIEWMKNGETLVLKDKKYDGGGLKDGSITITSPTKADRGIYACTVTNAVGSIFPRLKLKQLLKFLSDLRQFSNLKFHLVHHLVEWSGKRVLIEKILTAST